jgi:GR25 family glycosyltransferase involved in LPS biosynthesis
MSNKQNFNIYVINLDERLDKLEFITNQMISAGFNFKRISACKPDNPTINQKQDFMPPAKVQANWNSHLLAYKKLLESDENFCLILEDDCVISETGLNILRIINLYKSFEFDILQIGFLRNENKLKFNSILESKIKLNFFKYLKEINMKWNLIKNYPKLIKFLDKKIKSLEFEINYSKELKLNDLIVSEFLSGTHAYLIKREMAKSLLNYNIPITMGADLALEMLCISGNWKIYRTPESFASQYNFPVDIGKHEKFERDIGSHILDGKKR